MAEQKRIPAVHDELANACERGPSQQGHQQIDRSSVDTSVHTAHDQSSSSMACSSQDYAWCSTNSPTSDESSPNALRRDSRPGVARAAISAALLLATTLLLNGTHALWLPNDLAAGTAKREREGALPHSGGPQPQLHLAQLHPDCFNDGRGRSQGQSPARQGECWEAFGMQRSPQLNWMQSILHPLTWWRMHFLQATDEQHQAAAAAAAADEPYSAHTKGRRSRGTAGRRNGIRDGNTKFNEDSRPWSSFNDSSMAQIFSHDVAWMMHREQERARTGNRSHPGLDVQLAKSLAHLQSIAYCDPNNVRPWNCTRCKNEEAASDFQLFSLIEDVPWDLRAFVGYAPVLGAKVVAFRGTDSRSWYNWAENMRTWRVDLQLPYPGAQGSLVHSGFFYSYNLSSLRPNVSAAGIALEAKYPGQPWYVIGHSMGAAMATVAALDLRYSLEPRPDIRLYTFGSPRVGNDIFADFFKTAIQESYRFTHNRDIVPSVPLQIMGFHHIAREVWILTFEAGPNIISLCDGSGEDPACHNSVCYLGLCTSIVDHLNYLGGHMYHRNPIGC